MISFASDNYASACPEVMEALQSVNQGHAPAYGNDGVTQAAIESIQQALGIKAPIWFVGTGTAANTLALKSVLKSYESVISTDSAHIITNETGAPHHICGAKFITRPHVEGKLTPELIRDAYDSEACWGVHATRPRVVSISQTTEFGTVYTLEELAAIRVVCDELNLLLHVDGCRLYNAAAALGCSLEELVRPIDLLSLGGTKAGLMFGEAVVFINPALADGFEYLQKQGLQLFSKMRYVSAQFRALFTDELALRMASRTNLMARRLWEGLNSLGSVELIYPAESNMLFVRFPADIVEALQAHTYFYMMPGSDISRLVLSHDVQTEHVDGFLDHLSALIGHQKAPL